jgi:hypothetical protein
MAYQLAKMETPLPYQPQRRSKRTCQSYERKLLEIRGLCKSISNTQDPVLSTASWKSLQVHILFDLFFAMEIESNASVTLNKFLFFGDSEMRFYNPYWLAAYVFAPINTICQNMVVLLRKPLTMVTGANATSKQKLFIVLKHLLLVEYFDIIMIYANSDKDKYFILFKNHQDNEALGLQPAHRTPQTFHQSYHIHGHASSIST